MRYKALSGPGTALLASTLVVASVLTGPITARPVGAEARATCGSGTAPGLKFQAASMSVQVGNAIAIPPALVVTCSGRPTPGIEVDFAVVDAGARANLPGPAVGHLGGPWCGHPAPGGERAGGGQVLPPGHGRWHDGVARRDRWRPAPGHPAGEAATGGYRAVLQRLPGTGYYHNAKGTAYATVFAYQLNPSRDPMIFTWASELPYLPACERDGDTCQAPTTPPSSMFPAGNAARPGTTTPRTGRRRRLSRPTSRGPSTQAVTWP
jgi:hypothetical protein